MSPSFVSFTTSILGLDCPTCHFENMSLLSSKYLFKDTAALKDIDKCGIVKELLKYTKATGIQF